MDFPFAFAFGFGAGGAVDAVDDDFMPLGGGGCQTILHDIYGRLKSACFALLIKALEGMCVCGQLMFSNQALSSHDHGIHSHIHFGAGHKLRLDVVLFRPEFFHALLARIKCLPCWYAQWESNMQDRVLVKSFWGDRGFRSHVA